MVLGCKVEDPERYTVTTQKLVVSSLFQTDALNYCSLYLPEVLPGCEMTHLKHRHLRDCEIYRHMRTDEIVSGFGYIMHDDAKEGEDQVNCGIQLFRADASRVTPGHVDAPVCEEDSLFPIAGAKKYVLEFCIQPSSTNKKTIERGILKFKDIEWALGTIKRSFERRTCQTNVSISSIIGAVSLVAVCCHTGSRKDQLKKLHTAWNQYLNEEWKKASEDRDINLLLDLVKCKRAFAVVLSKRDAVYTSTHLKQREEFARVRVFVLNLFCFMAPVLFYTCYYAGSVWRRMDRLEDKIQTLIDRI